MGAVRRSTRDGSKLTTGNRQLATSNLDWSADAVPILGFSGVGCAPGGDGGRGVERLRVGRFRAPAAAGVTRGDRRGARLGERAYPDLGDGALARPHGGGTKHRADPGL